jgi:predicted nuclease of predicted toxin-antitoxin system
MKIYLDDDSTEALLVRLLQADGHDIVVCDQVGNRGIEDPAHFLYAITDGRALLTGNHDDFKLLHKLVVGSGGRHPGVLVVRRDDNPTRDLKAKGVVRALRKLMRSGAPITEQFIILNHWR